MKKILVLALCAIFAFSVGGCKKTDVTESTESIVASEAVMETEGEIIINSVDMDSEEGVAAMEAAKTLLDAFISADIDAIKSVLHKDDLKYFNFESADQVEFYKTILPMLTYEFKAVDEHQGVYGVDTYFNSPNMADIYGKIILEITESANNGESFTTGDAREKINERLHELLNSEELLIREGRVYVYVECIDGKYIPRCDMFLANELLGGYPEYSDEIGSVLNDTIDTITQ